jgi:serine/threonine protein kinase
VISQNSIEKSELNINSLQPYLLESVMETGEEIGRGAYGVVYKIRRWGTICAAKKLHDLPLQVQLQGSTGFSEDLATSSGRVAPDSTSSVGLVKSSKRVTGGSFHGHGHKSTAPVQSRFCSANVPSKRADILAKFEKECHLLSNLRHPYIVQFLGVYIEKASGTPVIVMEYLPNSLSSLVKSKPTIPRYLQISILYNIALGLAFLHGHTPSIIHRDLTANNVLLTSNMVAKIADLGVARILDLTPTRAMQLTQAPGTAAYMPPETLAQDPSYNTKMDIFSFGVLSLHLVSQVWPIPTEPVQVVPGGRLIPVSEIDRRKAQFDLMGSSHCVFQLTTQCLQNDPGQRPEITKVVRTLEALQSKFPLPSTSYLDLLQVRGRERRGGG